MPPSRLPRLLEYENGWAESEEEEEEEVEEEEPHDAASDKAPVSA